MSVYSENGNGDILLSDSEFAESLCGMSAEDAAQKLAGRAFAAGLVREGENAVRITVAADKNSSAKELQTVLESSVTGTSAKKARLCPCSGERRSFLPSEKRIPRARWRKRDSERLSR